MISVAVAGCLGKMGSVVVNAVEQAPDMELVCGIDPALNSHVAYSLFPDIETALNKCTFDCLVDFTKADSAIHNIECALSAGIDCVVGTTGISQESLEALAQHAKGNTALFYAPNFTTGAVLMMQFAKAAAPYFPEAEVIEYHHAHKADAPSGTAIRTAETIASSRKEAGSEINVLPDKDKARGLFVEDVPVHSVRSMGFVANQDVIFGSMGQSLTISHQSWDRSSYMPGVLLGIRNVAACQGLVIGLENFL